MIVHHITEKPLDHEYGDISALNEGELDEVAKLGVNEVWYWYSAGSYEGMGGILMRKGDEYDVYSMSHCSCYGPTDDVEFSPRPFADLVNCCTKEYLNELGCLFECVDPNWKVLLEAAPKAPKKIIKSTPTDAWLDEIIDKWF